MKVKILGFNLFAKGGTSRSNINLIKSFIKSNHEVTYYNFKSFDKTAKFNTMINEQLFDKKLNFEQFEDAKCFGDADLVILTRETFLYIAREIKSIDHRIKIVGEIHAPLAYIYDGQDLAFDAIDAYRVSTTDVKNDFMKRFEVTNVFNQYVDAAHINVNSEPSVTKRNLLIKARFEDNIKDISYVIKLMNQIVNMNGHDDIQLYIKGYGPSEILYKNLIDYYHLEEHVHINEREPKNYVYVSSSPYETLGYSILESIAEGNKAFIFAGEDGVLKKIYQDYHAVDFLEKDIQADCERLITFIDDKYTKEQRAEDVALMKATFIDRDYASDFIESANACMDGIKKGSADQIVNKTNTNKRTKLEHGRDLYEQYKTKPVLRAFLNNEKVFKFAKKKYEKRKTNKLKQLYDQITPSDQKVFIESFHGNNFSGDPKYLAIYIKEHFPEKEVYVSSRNALVDMEIRNYKLIPVRFGSEIYNQTFRACKYVIVNGNTLDKVFKHKDQIFVQTWHGFPLKRMLNDLEDEVERNEQVQAFKPRMKNWDYLLTSSAINTMLLESSFGIKDEENLKILQLGAPRNEYLLQSSEEESEHIRSKYFFTKSKNKKFILFCPTWRKGNREILSKINLIILLEQLPEEYEIIVKLHPNESHLRMTYSELSDRVHCFYNELVDIQELYLISEAMITDYSSTIFDFAHLNKPIFLLQEDTEDYSQQIGFYFDIFELVNIEIASNDERILARQLLEKKAIDYQNITTRLLEADKIGTTENIVNFIMK
ncbi:MULTISPECIES: CDP-glycerol glycerophosphotransferase family protein [Mammaliicoccus]|uniref:Glycosyl transferase family 1 n=5 Tax=Mammaliicoccus vitulinus TaxID=71237 RepID=A0A2T4PRY7_9STAP|nr:MULTISPECIES: CDP-glycerol glycerophosphotransferase family protein [Mammaliicoccus]MBO3076944.1 CDP-glycerol glycerophosphotransferase family protein [Mammaliicoccus vitulinus]PTI29011.1 glycosyl transferase family 1 [Mammaliicoccus vitulinus]PTI70678.1 glycosyl transferase family 1 [Mammaliicoccus vitulinus]HAL08768.1 glycosyl transferase family 1 [Staphylococcus sp.]